MFRLVYWEDLREHFVQSEAVVFPIKYREVKLTCWKHKTERWKYHQRQSAATPTYTRELGSHNRYVWKVPITRHPKGWEVQCPKWSMSVQSAKGSDTESTLMICLTSKRWAPQQPKLSSHTCHTWYLWQREGPPFPQKKDTAAGSQTWQTKSTDPWSEDPWFISGVISGGFQTKRGWFSLTLPPRQLWVRKKNSHTLKHPDRSSWTNLMLSCVRWKTTNAPKKVGILSFHHKKMVETVLQRTTPA